jgi:3-oxoacyl-[acyl-carrier protein] reductase
MTTPNTMLSLLLLSLADSAASRLSGQSVLVTGGGRGIGRAIALFCAEVGARVAILARTLPELQAVSEEAKQQHGAEMYTITADVTAEHEVEAAVAAVAAELGGVDILVNNAGGASTKAPLHEQSSADVRALLELNVVGVHAVSSAVLRHCMLPAKRGRIINISSRAGKVGLPNMGPYVASKFAVEGLTASMAAELREAGVTVNSISPGMVDTRSFPKAPGRPGVRSAESVKDGFFALLESGRSGVYLHVDELDEAAAAGQPDAALKPIDEPTFSVEQACEA